MKLGDSLRRLGFGGICQRDEPHRLRVLRADRASHNHSGQPFRARLREHLMLLLGEGNARLQQVFGGAHQHQAAGLPLVPSAHELAAHTSGHTLKILNGTEKCSIVFCRKTRNSMGYWMLAQRLHGCGIAQNRYRTFAL